ncbi:hypothetical protein, partial [Burkholderia multivorans]|uniref:hypothetical protein n=1 Tax=Burkholderia multivorans TaxID=87883 RepID=UPI0028701447
GLAGSFHKCGTARRALTISGRAIKQVSLSLSSRDGTCISKQPITRRAFKDRRYSPSADKSYISRRFHKNREKFHILAKLNR